MSKVLKLVRKTIAVIVVTLLSLSVALYFLVQLPAVQTMLVHRITHSLQEQLPNSSIAVGSVHYALFNRLVINDIYAGDIHGDTLLYVKTAAVNISRYNFTTQAFTISAAHLYRGVLNLYDGPQTNNINEVFRKLPKNDSTPETVDKGPAWDVQVKEIALSDFRFTYRNLRKPTINPDPAVIDFKDLAISDINVNIEDLKVQQDTIFFRIKDINFYEKSGYRVRKLSAKQVYVCAKQVMLKKVVIDDDHSLLTLNHYSMSFDSRHDFKDYPEKVVMSAGFDNALFSLASLNHYAKGFHADSIQLRLQGTAGGTVDRLRSRLLSITLENGPTAIATSFRITGLPDINATAFNLNIRDLNTNANDVSYILKDLVKEGYTPATENMIRQLGDIQFKGAVDGLYNDFVAHGDASTSIGYTSLDMLFHKTAGKSFTAEGQAQVKQFNIGKFLHLPWLGTVSSRAKTRLTFRPTDSTSFQLQLAGDISKFEVFRYAYSNIKVDGLLNDRYFEGDVKSNDPNLKMDFKGYVAFNNGKDSAFVLRHDYTADIQHANLQQLHFNTRDSISELKARLTANYQYRQHMDNGTGKIEVADAFYRSATGVHNAGNISLLFLRENNDYHMQLRSGFADADYRGPLPLLNFIEDFKHAAYLKRLPLLGDSTQYSHHRTTDYTFDIQFKRINGLAAIIHPELVIGDQTKINSRLTPSGAINIDMDSPVLALGNDYLQKVTLQGASHNKLLNFRLNVNNAQLLGFNIRNITTGIDVDNNVVDTKISYNNNSQPENKGMLHFNTSFTPNAPGVPPIIHLNIHPSNITVNDTVWSMAPASITINDRTLSFDKVSVYNQHQQIAVQGVISPLKTDTLEINFHNVDLSNFNTVSQQKDFILEGLLSGDARLSDLYGQAMFYADFKGERIVVNNRPLDYIAIKSSWDNDLSLIRLTTVILEKDKPRLQLTGIYHPKKDSLNLHTAFRNFALAHASPLFNGVLSNINGSLSGDVAVKGSLKAPQLYGSNVTLENAGLTVDYLNTHYTFSTPVNISPEQISIHEAEITDNAGGSGMLSGTLIHRVFKDPKYDLQITPNNLLCMNTTIRDNELFYGKAYATGVAIIKGDRSNIHFDITARTDPNTICYIPLSNASRAKESSILTFKTPVNDDDSDDEWTPVKKTRTNPGQHITMEMNLTATPAAEVQIIFDEKAGDIIRGRGNGSLRLSLDPSINKFDLFGDYAIDQGDYFFTLENFFGRKFIIEQGSHMLFNGDINRTVLDITALYKTKAPLNTLISDTTSAVGSVRRPVDCRIKITDNLLNPTLNYEVDVQNLDPSTRAQVDAALNTEEKMSRQFLSLLAFSSFMPDDLSGVSSISLSSSALEMLSNQFNNMISQLNIPFDVDVGLIYNSATNSGEQSNVDMELSLQFFDSRLLISGRSNSKYYNANFTGDIDIEYKLDKQGRFRGKAFSHSADLFTDQLDNSQRSGVGIIYQEDFNNFMELFQRWFGRRKKKDEKTKDQ